MTAEADWRNATTSQEHPPWDAWGLAAGRGKEGSSTSSLRGSSDPYKHFDFRLPASGIVRG